MSNSYYNHTTYPTPNSPGSSSTLRLELDAITTGFSLLPTLAANGYKVAMVNSAGTALIASSALQSLAITLSTLNSTPIGASSASTGAFTTVSATTFTGALTGNASTATALATARTIGGTSFDGTANVTSFPAPGAIGGTTPSTGAFTSITASTTLGVTGVATFTAQPIVSSLTASKPVFTDASSGLTSAGTLAYDQGGTGQTSYAAGDIVYASGINTLAKLAIGTSGQRLVVAAGVPSWATDTTVGTVTSVSWTGGIVSVATATTTPAFTIAGTSGGVPYFSSGTTWATSAALAASALVIGGGAGAAPSTTTTGTGVVTALGVNVGTAGAFVVNGGALGTPSGGTVTNLTGTASININGTVGATTATTGAFTTLSATGLISTTQGTDAIDSFSATPAVGTDRGLLRFTNTGGNTLFGMESSVGGTTILGSTAYDSIIRWASGKGLSFGDSSTALYGRWTSTGLAVTGTLSATGTLSGGTSGTAYSFSGSAPATSLTLDASGNLGIGTTSPTQLLELNGTSNLRFAMGVGNPYIQTNAQDLTFGTRTADLVTIKSGGNVGIGTTSPTSKLQSQTSSSGSTPNMLSLVNNTGGAANATGVKLWMSGRAAQADSDRGTYIESVTTDTNNAHAMAFATSASGAAPAERARFNSTGALVFAGGTTTADGIGITFPATQSASSDANTLDDYEEGTWTATATADTGTITTFTSEATYVKVGSVVTVRAAIKLTNSGTAAGQMVITGYPFTSYNYTDNSRASTFLVREDNLTGTAYQGFISDNSTGGQVTTMTNGAISWTNNSVYIFQATYHAAF